MKPNDHLPLSGLSFGILLALADTPRHGYAIMQEIGAVEGCRVPGAGSLYAALDRLQNDSLIERVEPPAGEKDQRRRYYSLTELGRAVAQAESRRLAHLLERASRKKLVSAGLLPG